MAKRAGTQSKAKPKPGKDAAKALKAIEAAAEAEVKANDEALLLKEVNEVVRALVEADKVHTMKQLSNSFVSFRQVAAKGHPGLKDAAAVLQNWGTDEDVNEKIRQAVNNALSKACRDMTQPLVNLAKALTCDRRATGLTDRVAVAVPKLAKSLTPYANPKSSFTVGLEPKALAQLIRTVAVNATLYDQVAKELPG